MRQYKSVDILSSFRMSSPLHKRKGPYWGFSGDSSDRYAPEFYWLHTKEGKKQRRRSKRSTWSLDERFDHFLWCNQHDLPRQFFLGHSGNMAVQGLPIWETPHAECGPTIECALIISRFPLASSVFNCPSWLYDLFSLNRTAKHSFWFYMVFWWRIITVVVLHRHDQAVTMSGIIWLNLPKHSTLFCNTLLYFTRV